MTFTATDSCSVIGTAQSTVTIQEEVTVVVDLDINIKKFQVSKQGRLGGNPVRVSLTVKNAGDVDEPAQAMVTGVQNGITVYSQALDVSDAPGNGSTRWDFPNFTPLVSGDINWTATIADGDPDTATATTSVR